ncbi:MAG: hypothetical protein JWR01_2266, partial [Subtercola sp.]|nr:hypothetical protein [Subtercola sp.]
FGTAGPAAPIGGLVLVACLLTIFIRSRGNEEPLGVVGIAALAAAGLFIAFGVLVVFRAASETRDRRYQRAHLKAVVVGCRLAKETRRSLALISEPPNTRHGSYFLTLVADDDGLRIIGGQAAAQEVLHLRWSQVVGALQPTSICEPITASNGVLLPIRLPTHTEVLRIVLLDPGFPGILPPGAQKTEEWVRHLNARRDVAWGRSAPEETNHVNSGQEGLR